MHIQHFEDQSLALPNARIMAVIEPHPTAGFVRPALWRRPGLPVLSLSEAVQLFRTAEAP